VVYAQTDIGLLWYVGSSSNTATTLHITCYTKNTVCGRWSFPAALASTAWPTANKTAPEIFWFIVKWSLNLFCHCFRTLLPSGEFSGIVSTAPLCQWKGENCFLSLLKKGRKFVTIFFQNHYFMYYTIYTLHLLKARNAEYSLPVTCRWRRVRACGCVCVWKRDR